MEVTLHIPDNIASQLNGDLSRRALEAWAIQEYQNETLSVGEVAEMLGISVYEADGILKQHGIESSLTRDDLNEQRAALDSLLGQ